MEVHAHSHTAADPDSHRGRKKWTHYLWEFLMLFLAVFCGFLAEYQLEHKIEKEKGKQYIKSFAEDLATDTSIFSGLIKSYEEKVVALRTLFSCYDAVSETVSSDSCLLNLFIHSSNFPDLVYTDRTLQQLKNAGGLRLISGSDADSISGYDKLLRMYQKIETTSYQEIQTAIRASIYSLNNFNTTINHNYANGSAKDHIVTNHNDVNRSANDHVLFSQDKNLLNSYFNQLFYYLLGAEDNLVDLKEIDKKAKGLLIFFRNKYHLK